MINAVGLANPGRRGRARRAPAVARARRCRSARKLVNVVGFAVEEFAAVIEQLELRSHEASGALDGFELNVSCPNVKAGGMEFGADPRSARRGRAPARAPRRSGRCS